VDGFIVLAPRLSPEIAHQFFRTREIVSIQNAGSINNCINIDIDSEAGAYLATKHLIELGHTKIAHVTGAPVRSGTELRIEGYKKALFDSGISYDPNLLIRGFYSMQSGLDAAHIFVQQFKRDQLPTAVFCANDESACGFVGGLRSHGLRVPEDISVIGFDDSPTASSAVLELTTIRQPLRSMASFSMSILLDYIEGKSHSGKAAREIVLNHNRTTYYKDIEGVEINESEIIFKPRLIIRTTTSEPKH
jgi:DNA-binding LacI/PurR family transcriptional regulator